MSTNTPTSKIWKKTKTLRNVQNVNIKKISSSWNGKDTFLMSYRSELIRSMKYLSKSKKVIFRSISKLFR